MTSHSPSGIAEAPNMATLRAHRREIVDIGGAEGCIAGSGFRFGGTGDATSGSDIDLPFDFDTSHRGLDLFAFAREVEQLLGHRVEVGTEVHPVITDKVEAEAVLL